jgi:type II secretory pathway pseudopilin PulG
MSNPSGPDQDSEPTDSEYAEAEITEAAEQHADPETEIIVAQDAGAGEDSLPSVTPGERRFTAPSAMDAGSTQIIDRAPDPETEIIGFIGEHTGPGNAGDQDAKTAVPQAIPGRDGAAKPPARRRSWGWVLAVILVIAAVVAIAALVTVLLTRSTSSKASQEEQVRQTIQNYDTALQKGDLAALRSITCGETAENYNKYEDKKWSDIHNRVEAAGQYPVVASIDQVVVNGDHAEANVTTFMESDPATRSTRSLDLQFRDEQWKICQSPAS